MLLNVLSNARKFVPKDYGKIQIKASLIDEDDRNFLEIKVSDNGPGISTSDQQKLFQPFSKLAAHSSLNPKGNGLGLYICRLICRNLGGDITVDSIQGSGCTFTIRVGVERVPEHDLDGLLSPQRGSLERIES